MLVTSESVADYGLYRGRCGLGWFRWGDVQRRVVSDGGEGDEGGSAEEGFVEGEACRLSVIIWSRGMGRKEDRHAILCRDERAG